MAQRDDLDVPTIATVGAVSTILTIAAVFAVQALYFSYASSEIDRKVVSVPTANADSRLAEQEAKLARYSWVSRDEGRATVPIERAMQLVVEEYRLGAMASSETLPPTDRSD